MLVAQLEKFLASERVQLWESHLVYNLELRQALTLDFQVDVLIENRGFFSRI